MSAPIQQIQGINSLLQEYLKDLQAGNFGDSSENGNSQGGGSKVKITNTGTPPPVLGTVGGASAAAPPGMVNPPTVTADPSFVNSESC